jgi:predicted PolB exonuclease-like 3'-5' exonuclease
MTPILVFDIETIPDCEGIRKIHALPAELPDREVAEVAFQKRRVQSGGASDFLPVHLQRVLVISCVLRTEEDLRIFSIGEPEVAEAAAIQRFFDGVDKYSPQLVSWNGRTFDLPVLVNRGLVHGVGAACFWDTGDEAKYNNYINRFHERHCDLMVVLSIYGGRGSPLDELARLAGFPGKLGVGGGAVWESFLAGGIEAIRNYCEADTLNTYLLYLRFQLMRCSYTPERYQSELALVRSTLEKRTEPHWREFLSLWKT